MVPPKYGTFFIGDLMVIPHFPARSLADPDSKNPFRVAYSLRAEVQMRVAKLYAIRWFQNGFVYVYISRQSASRSGSAGNIFVEIIRKLPGEVRLGRLPGSKLGLF